MEEHYADAPEVAAAHSAANNFLASNPQAPVSRAKKVGGSYQADGTIVSTFATLAGETRHVFEFDQPAGMLHIFGPGQVEIAAAPQVASINIKDFGADPSGKNDSTAAVQAAIDHASKISAPQVVADERAAFEVWVRKTSAMPQKFADQLKVAESSTAWMAWQARAALAAAPVPSNSPELHGIAAAPVQAVAVPDGPYTFTIGEDGEYMILDKDGRQVGTVLYYHHAKAIAAALAAPAAQGDATQAAIDVLAERRRQIEVEGRTAGSDDRHIDCQLARAAATYALCTEPEQLKLQGLTVWPWGPHWWKFTDYRRNLVKSGALVLAEIDRIDRAAIAAKAAS